jgi:SepF-like predicted cell division protein (DUF552 family)
MMRDLWSNVKNKIKSGMTTAKDDFGDEGEEEYLELDTDAPSAGGRRTKILIRPFVLEDFSDVKNIIDALRDGYTICLVNIRPLKSKDVVELKRAINKLKKTCDALSGDIAGFSEEWIVVTPGFAEIHRAKSITRARPRDSEGRTERIPDEYDEERGSSSVLEQYESEDIF